MAVRNKLITALTAVALALCMVGAHASVVINGTRVIYPSDEREVTVKLSNEGSLPALVQAWLDDGDPRALPQDSVHARTAALSSRFEERADAACCLHAGATRARQGNALLAQRAGSASEQHEY
jgi:hypothetical protein